MHARPRIVLTRRGDGNARVREALADVDVEWVEYPCIDVVPADLPVATARAACADAAALVFVSRHAVQYLFALVPDLPPPPEVIALGSGTDEALHAHGWHSTALPSRAIAEVLAVEAASLVQGPGHIVVVRGQLGDDAIADGFRELGRTVHELVVYRTLAPDLVPLAPAPAPTLVVFASDSAVRHFSRVNDLRTFPDVLAIGPSTARACEQAGLHPRVAPDPSVKGLAHAIRHWIQEIPR